MLMIRFADGRAPMAALSQPDAVEWLEAQGYHVENCGARTLAWSTPEDATDDPSLAAVAEVL